MSTRHATKHSSPIGSGSRHLPNSQSRLWEHPQTLENSRYLTNQIITYIGNKRSRLEDIGLFLNLVKRRLGTEQLRIFDVFSGSGIVSRFFKSHSSRLVANDFEDYAAVISRCYLANRSEIDVERVRMAVAHLNQLVESSDMPIGFIRELYAPYRDDAITETDRVFYTTQNARRIDDYRRLIDVHYPDISTYLLGPLLSKASVHSNTAGVFKGFYKNRKTGVGQFGGTGLDALERILGVITLEPPPLSNVECDYDVLQKDANEAARDVRNIDLAYVDPPYNQHPYGSNYFMLNLITNYVRPTSVSKVAGIPTDWRRSGYNVRSRSSFLLFDLLESLDAKFVMISFNDEGFISRRRMENMLHSLGSFQLLERPYNAFRGSRNFTNRPIHVTEQLFLLEKD